MRHTIAAILVLIVTATVGLAASGNDPEKDPQMEKLLWDAKHMIDRKTPAAAISKCDTVIAAYKTYYGHNKEKIYCSRSAPQTLGSLIESTLKKENAIAISSIWADAYFIKAYALQDLHRLGEARATLELALKLSPTDSHYLSELGEIYALEKNWAKAKKAYQEAEDNASLEPKDMAAEELARARRGLGYVLVELGKFDEAEKKYRQCLAANPNDTKAKAELQYVRQQKAKR